MTHLIHMEKMKWSSKSLLGVLAANNLGFGLALEKIGQTFGQQQINDGMACPKSATHQAFMTWKHHSLEIIRRK
jgi:hypothetical protein